MSDSNSQTSQQTNQQDNRRVIGQNGISAENSNVTVTTLDADVVNQVLKSMGSTTGQALTVMGNQNKLVAGALSDSLSQSLGFGAKALTLVGNATADALDFANSNAKINGNLASSAVSDSLAASSSAFSSALGFADKQNTRAFDTVAATENLVANAYADAKGRGALTDKILIGAIAAMAVVAFAAISK